MLTLEKERPIAMAITTAIAAASAQRMTARLRTIQVKLQQTLINVLRKKKE